MLCFDSSALFGPILLITPIESIVTLPKADVTLFLCVFLTASAATFKLKLRVVVDII